MEIVLLDVIEPGTQGYTRYDHAANTPARWTDPSGRSVSDAAAPQVPIHAIVAQTQALAPFAKPFLDGIRFPGILATLSLLYWKVLNPMPPRSC